MAILFGWGGGDVTEKNYLYLGGVHGKFFSDLGGSCNILMTVQKNSTSPLYLVKNERSLGLRGFLPSPGSEFFLD